MSFRFTCLYSNKNDSDSSVTQIDMRKMTVLAQTPTLYQEMAVYYRKDGNS